MTNTVRKRLLDAIRTGLAGLGGGALVGLVSDAAKRLPGQDEVGIGRCVAEDQKVALELVAFDDEPGADAGTDVESWAMPVAVFAHLPDDLQGREPSDWAADLHAQIYALYRGTPGAETWGGLAQDTECLGGGGVAISDLATRETVSAFRVKYRHTVGNPEEPR